jgi:hypothetical protein
MTTGGEWDDEMEMVLPRKMMGKDPSKHPSSPRRNASVCLAGMCDLARFLLPGGADSSLFLQTAYSFGICTVCMYIIVISEKEGGLGRPVCTVYMYAGRHMQERVESWE